jgi:hypothetical protein
VAAWAWAELLSCFKVWASWTACTWLDCTACSADPICDDRVDSCRAADWAAWTKKGIVKVNSNVIPTKSFWAHTWAAWDIIDTWACLAATMAWAFKSRKSFVFSRKIKPDG